MVWILVVVAIIGAIVVASHRLYGKVRELRVAHREYQETCLAIKKNEAELERLEREELELKIEHERLKENSRVLNELSPRFREEIGPYLRRKMTEEEEEIFETEVLKVLDDVSPPDDGEESRFDELSNLKNDLASWDTNGYVSRNLQDKVDEMRVRNYIENRGISR